MPSNKTYIGQIKCPTCNETVIGEVTGTDEQRVKEEVEINSFVVCRKCMPAPEQESEVE